MSRLWNPNQHYDSIALWLDGNDPNNNNSQGLPDSGKTAITWKDKSKNNIQFTAFGYTNFNNPEYLIDQVTELTFTGGAGYTDGTYQEVRLAAVSPSTGTDIYLNLVVSGGAVTEILSISGNHGFQVGDTLEEATDLNSGNTNAVFTVSKIERRGGLLSGISNSDALDSFESESLSAPLTYLDVYIAGNFRSRDYANISFVGLDDTGDNDRDIFLTLDSSTANKVLGGVKYTHASGSGTFGVQITENEPHIYHYRLASDGTQVKIDGFQQVNPINTTPALFPETTYRWTVFNNVDTNPFVSLKSRGTMFEVIVFDKPIPAEDQAKCEAYLAQKYGIPLSSSSPYFEKTAYASSLFNGAHKLSPRRPIQVVKMYLDFCDNVYGSPAGEVNNGVSTCTANGATGSECYNTRHTCQDLTNYRLDTNGRRVYTFTNEVGDTLAGQLPNAHPALISVSSAPVEIAPTKGVSLRGNVSIKLRDFVSTGSEDDLYAATRDIIALENGTFFQKLMQRNIHYVNRPIEIYDGYIDYLGNPQIYDGKKEYIIESVELNKDTLSIKAKDPMTLADEFKAKVPSPTKFSLGATLNTGTHNHIPLKFNGLDLDGDVAADKQTVIDEFGADNATGFVRINDEILAYTVDVSGSHAALDFTGRGEWGSDDGDEAYDEDDSIQKCVFFGQYDGGGTAVTINDAAYDLLVNRAGVPAIAINNDEGGQYSWADQKRQWLASFRIDAIFSEPAEVNKQLSQLGGMVGVNFFYDDITTQIVMRAETPELDLSEIVTITDDVIIEDSLKFINSEKERLSRVYYYYNMRNHVEDRDKPKNYKNLFVAVDSDGELPSEYGKESSKTIYGYGVSDSSTATSVAQRILSRFKNTPKTVTFQLDASNQSIKTGDHFYLNTKHIVDFNGIPLTTEMQVLSIKFDNKNQLYMVKAKTFRFTTINSAGVAADDAGAFSTGGGSGTDADPYTGVRTVNSYLADANHITISIINGGENFGNGETIEFTPAEDSGDAANTRNLAVTYSQTNGVITSINSVSSNAAAGALPTAVHDNYDADEILVGTGSSGTGLQVRIVKRPRMSGGQEPYTAA